MSKTVETVGPPKNCYFICGEKRKKHTGQIKGEKVKNINTDK
jgi:hypothetical protein